MAAPSPVRCASVVAEEPNLSTVLQRAGAPAGRAFAHEGEARMASARLQIGDESIEVQRFGRLLGTVIQRDISGLQA
jgi:hypothetical protein